ncbi:SDR family NAD(P)-dependent oxidoreductase [Chloroflexota bacterium]
MEHSGGLLSRFSLESKVAIVTGAGRGIGKGIALAFADAGADIVVAELTQEQALGTAEEVRAQGRKALALAADVTDGEQVQNIVDATLREFGKIDVLVNNVGGSSGARVSPLEMTEEVWDESIKRNLKSTFLCTRAVGRVMIDRKKGGSIINLSSSAGRRGQMRSVAYSAAKAGIINFTLSMSNYLAPHNIRVNCIAPGRIVSEGTRALGSDEERAKEYAIPLRRIGQAEDVALAAIYLASDAASFVTGVTLDVAGGEYLGGLTLQMAEKFWAGARKPTD